MQTLSEQIRETAKLCGFSVCGIAPGHLAPETGQRLHQWLNDGHHGDMIWMETRATQRQTPENLWPDVRSVIMLGMSYAPDADPMAMADTPDSGRISVYAQGGDYHKTVKKALKQLARWLVETIPDTQLKVFVDTSPVMEKPLAEAAGIGWQGKHSNIVSQSHGSWLFLGAIYTNMVIETDSKATDRCGSCSACQTICPTNAFIAPYRLDARACISYLTIEHAGPIAHKYRKAMGNHIYGCDDCLAVCPWNKFADSAQRNMAFLPRAELAAPKLADLLALDDAAFRDVFSGSPIKRSGRNRMVRNALIAAGNSKDMGFIDRIITLLDDASPIVRCAAIWALAQIDPMRFHVEHQIRAAAEVDPWVQAEWRGQCPVELGLAAA